VKAGVKAGVKTAADATWISNHLKAVAVLIEPLLGLLQLSGQRRALLLGRDGLKTKKTENKMARKRSPNEEAGRQLAGVAKYI